MSNKKDSAITADTYEILKNGEGFDVAEFQMFFGPSPVENRQSIHFREPRDEELKSQLTLLFDMEFPTGPGVYPLEPGSDPYAAIVWYQKFEDVWVGDVRTNLSGELKLTIADVEQHRMAGNFKFTIDLYNDNHPQTFTGTFDLSTVSSMDNSEELKLTRGL